MGIPRLCSLATRRAVLPLLTALSACATAGAARSIGPAGDRESAVERGPRVQIWTTDEFGTGNRVRASFRLDDDAYVIVVNVGLDGYANVIFPESPEDDGFMRGGRTYRLPAFFPGFANTFGGSRYARLYNATSVYDGVYDRYAGYVFIIASWRPMHFQVTEALGLWDDYHLAVHEQQLEPYVVMHRFADQLVPGGSRDYTARFARYAAFQGGLGRARSFASCSLYGPVLGYFPSWAFYTVGNWWMPIYGLGSYGRGSRCGFGYGVTLVGFRPPARPIVTQPVRPTPPPGSGDTAAKPRHPRRPRRPVASDSGERKSPPGGRRVNVAIEDEPIIDVNDETRDLARRRDRGADRVRRAVRGERGYQTPDGWRRGERARHGERSDVSRDVDRGEGARVRHRAPVDHGRARGESSRGESRAAEPRREPPPRPTPRSEPRSDARPQPAPRNDPAPRSEPAAKPEPRSERPARPAEPQ